MYKLLSVLTVTVLVGCISMQSNQVSGESLLALAEKVVSLEMCHQASFLTSAETARAQQHANNMLARVNYDRNYYLQQVSYYRAFGKPVTDLSCKQTAIGLQATDQNIQQANAQRRLDQAQEAQAWQAYMNRPRNNVSCTNIGGFVNCHAY